MNEKLRVNKLFQQKQLAVAWKLLQKGDIDSGRLLARKILEYSDTLEQDNIKAKAHSLIVLAEASRNEGQYTIAIALVHDAQLLYEDLESDVWLLRGLYISANSYDHLGNYSEALRIHHAQLDTAKSTDDYVHQATALRRIGALHGIRQQYDLGMEYLNQCLAIYKQTDDKIGLPGVYINISDIIRMRGDYQSALSYAQRALELHEEMNLIAPRAFSHSSLAHIYLAKGDEDLARHHLEQCLYYAHLSKRNYPQIFALQTAATINQQLEQANLVITHLQEALELARQSNDRYEEAKCMQLLADAYSHLGDFEQAYAYHQEYHTLQCQLWQDNTQTRFDTLEIIFRTKQAHIEASEQRLLSKQLEAKTKALEAFNYSVSHDLRAPLRGIVGFSQILQEDYKDVLNDDGKELLKDIIDSGNKMSDLINDMLYLSRVSLAEIHLESTDLSAIASSIFSDLQQREPHRRITYYIEPYMTAYADERLFRIVLDNLLGNAWKFTGKTNDAHISFKTETQDGQIVYIIEDNGSGFDMSYADRLFVVFQRLHHERDFDGTGIGLATVQRIINKHGGRIWAKSQPNLGATFYFTLPKNPDEDIIG